VSQSPIDLVLARLKGAGCNPRESGSGQWRSRCPAHQGSSSNLSIKEGDDGAVLLHCHHQDAGAQSCNVEVITRALDLTLQDLFPPRDGLKSRPGRQSGGNGKTYPTAEKAIGAAAFLVGGEVSKLGPWSYKTADGKAEVMRIYRIDMPDGDKQFRPVYRDSAGWHLGDPVKSGLPLYHLDELASAPMIVVLEGEKCADMVRDLGITATTSSHGSGSTEKSDWSPLAGKPVVIIPDHDKSGVGYQQAVGAILSGLNPAPTIKLLELPLKDEGDDVEQWLHGLPASWERAERKAELLRLIKEAGAWKPVSVVSVGNQYQAPPDFSAVDPRPIELDLLPVPRLEDVMIPERFRAWIVDIARRACIPPDYPMAASIVGLSGLIGRKLAIRPKRRDRWIVVVNVWGGAVGQPGSMKTAAVEEGFRQLKRLSADAMEAHKLELAAHAERCLIAAAKRAAAKKALEGAARKGADQVELARLAHEASGADQEEEPKAKRYVVNDTTIEKLGELMAENPNGLTLFRDELTGFLKTLERQGHESDRGFLLECWNGTGSYTFDRIGRGTTHIPAVCLAIFGTIQPGPLARYLRGSLSGEEADGFIPRFQVLVYPDSNVSYLYVDEFPDSDAKNRAYGVFRAVNELDPAALQCPVDDDTGLPYLGFEDDAQAFFVDWFTDLEKRLRSGSLAPIMASHLSKYRSLFPSLALIFHLIDSVESDDRIHRLDSVSLGAAEIAAAWCEYLECHAERIYQMASDGDPTDAIRLAGKIKDSLPNPFTVGDVQRKGWSGLNSTEEVRRALGILEDRGWVKIVEIPSPDYLGRGRSSEKVWINPKVSNGGNQP
jgi:hypothetical protein